MMCRSGAVCVHGVGRNEGRFGRLGGRALARKPDPILQEWIHSRLFLYLFLVEFGLGGCCYLYASDRQCGRPSNFYRAAGQ